jgi:hypothetical protein
MKRAIISLSLLLASAWSLYAQLPGTFTPIMIAGGPAALVDCATTNSGGSITVSTIGAYRYYYFKTTNVTATATFQCPDNRFVDYAVVGGGGGGGLHRSAGGAAGGGGGAGEFCFDSVYAITAGDNIQIQMGKGGAGTTTDAGTGVIGDPSIFNSTTLHGSAISAHGGGAGGYTATSGGSGGGSSNSGTGAAAGPPTCGGLVFAGGNSTAGYQGGGGGGAGGVGGNATATTVAGVGGPCVVWSGGDGLQYAAGGGGAADSTGAGAGGCSGLGGAGGNNGSGVQGTDGTGSGGGGGTGVAGTNTSGRGGGGAVVLRYNITGQLPVSSYNGPGNVVGGAAAWWGLRAYNKAQASAGSSGGTKTAIPLVNLRRSADSHTCDVLPNFADGNLGQTSNCSTGTDNNLSVKAFCTSSCLVAKLYDQSGAKQCGGAPCDVVQATTTNQPTLTPSCMGNLACMTYAAGSMTLASATGPTLAQPFSVSVLANRTGAFTTQAPFYSQATNTQFRFTSTANQVATVNGGTPQTAAATDNASGNHSFLGTYNVASSVIVVDTTNTPASGLAAGSGSGAFSIGPLTGTVSETGVWGQDLASSAMALCNNQYGFAYGNACGVLPPCTANTQGGGTYSNVIALYHFDGNGTDSTGGHNGTLFGTAAFSGAQAKFGSASLLNSPGANGFNIGHAAGLKWTGDFTFEWWIYFTNATTTYQGYMGDSQATLFLIQNGVGTQAFYTPSSGYLNYTYTIAGGAWHHWAWVRSGSTLTMYIDGVSTGTPTTLTSTIAIGNLSTDMLLAQTFPSGANDAFALSGYMDEVRLSNMARYTANFTPPAQPFCNN